MSGIVRSIRQLMFASPDILNSFRIRISKIRLELRSVHPDCSTLRRLFAQAEESWIIFAPDIVNKITTGYTVIWIFNVPCSCRLVNSVRIPTVHVQIRPDPDILVGSGSNFENSYTGPVSLYCGLIRNHMQILYEELDLDHRICILKQIENIGKGPDIRQIEHFR